MTITDRVYGKIKIDDPLIAELIASTPLRRLKGINQCGGSNFFEPQRDVTRFEHSVGVWYLLKKFGASRSEQVAGLLHDTPHTAFSHVIDFVFPNAGHTYHEQFEAEIIYSSEIPGILKKYNLSAEVVLDKSRFPLLEAELPDLSADRIDYFLRDTRIDYLFPQSLVNQFLAGIYVSRGRFYFKDVSLAGLYAQLFISAGRLLWLDPNSHAGFFLVAGALKRAISLGIISEADFFTTDAAVLAKLRKSRDPQINKILTRLVPGTRFVYAPKESAEFYGPNKPRVVDPWVKQGGKFTRVSDLIPRLNEFFNHYRETHKYLGVRAAQSKSD